MPKVEEEDTFLDNEDIQDELDNETEDRGDLLGEEEGEEEVDQEWDDDDDRDSEEDEEETDDFDEEYEEEDSDGEEDSDDRQGKNVRIPKDRFDEVIAQREDAREQVQLLSRQVEQLIDVVRGKETSPKEEAPKKEEFTYDFDAREADYMEAVLEGDTSKAASIRKEIRTAERKMFQQEQEDLVSKATESARSEARNLADETKFEKLIVENETKYPFLDQSTSEYNQDAVDKINSLFNRFVKAGSTKAEALQEAVDLIVPSYAKPVDEGKDKGLGGKKRKKQALKRNARANNAQPPRMKGKTTRENAINEYDVLNMTEKDFSKLPASVKKKLRGD